MASNQTEWFHHVCLRDGSIYLRWKGLFEFLLSPDGRQIVARPLNGSSREAFQTYLLGQVLSFALLRQGIEPFHATVVVIGGQAVGLMGDCGYGKSSLGAAFLQVGFPLLTDDLLVLKTNGRGFVAFPGLPRIKLFPEFARSVLGDAVNGTRMNNVTRKRIIRLDGDRFCPEVVPLKALYVIRPPFARYRAKRIAIRQLPKRAAFFKLIENTFNTRVTEPQRLQRQFLHAAAVASRVPVKLLSYPRTRAALASVREAVLADLRS